MKTATLRGADLVIQAIGLADVDWVFSLSGNYIMSIYDAAIDSGITLVHTRYEAAAVHMASGWAQKKGRAGVALLSSGAGHGNAMGAIHDALLAQAPIVVISGHAPLAELGKGAFQEMDQVALAKPVVKASWLVRDLHQIGPMIAQAFRLATTGTPGPVHVSIPNDILSEEAELASLSEVWMTPSSFISAKPSADEGLIARLTEQISDAQRPVVLTGPYLGREDTREHRARITNGLGVPMISIESPRGLRDPGLGALTDVLKQADLIVLLGKRPDYTLGYLRPPVVDQNTRLVLIDGNADTLCFPQESRRMLSHPVELIRADPRAVLMALAQQGVGKGETTEKVGWLQETEAALLRRSAGVADDDSNGMLHPADAVQVVRDAIVKIQHAVVVSDGGEFGQWVQAGIPKESLLINGPAGSIGGSLPMAIGAKAAVADGVPVIACMGDGAAGFHCVEVDTAIRHGLPIVAVIGNDGRWNSEYQLQKRDYGEGRFIATDLNRSNYHALADVFGGKGFLVSSLDELQSALEDALQSGVTSIINVQIGSFAAP